MERINETTSTRKRTWGDAPSDYKQDDSELKWYHIRHVRFTREYLAGILSGFGLGIVFMAFVTSISFVEHGYMPLGFFGFFLYLIGIYVHRDQQERSRNYSGNETKAVEITKWNSPRRFGLTGEAGAGTLTGFGCGILCIGTPEREYLTGSGWTLDVIVGLAVFMIGLAIQRRIQRKPTVNRNEQNKS